MTKRIDVLPTVSPLVRLEARRGAFVINQKSESVRLSALSRFVAQRLDGTRDRRALAEEIERAIESGGLDVDIALAVLSGNPGELTDASLRYMRDNALLIECSTREA
jgi:hypothetical protein